MIYVVICFSVQVRGQLLQMLTYLLQFIHPVLGPLKAFVQLQMQNGSTIKICHTKVFKWYSSNLIPPSFS